MPLALGFAASRSYFIRKRCMEFLVRFGRHCTAADFGRYKIAVASSFLQMFLLLLGAVS